MVNLPYDRHVEKVGSVQFYVQSPEDVLARSVVHVTKTDTYMSGVPVENGLFDLRMGTLSNMQECRTCFQRMGTCVGHSGHIRLAQPVYHAQFLPQIKKLLKVVCHRCSGLYINPQTHADASKVHRSHRLDHAVKASAKLKRCPACDGRKPDRVVKEPVIRLALVWKETAKEPEDKLVLTAEQVRAILSRLSDDACKAIGFSANNRPEWLVCTVLPCPPPCMRPSVCNDSGQRAEDDITHKLIDVLKANSVLQSRMDALLKAADDQQPQPPPAPDHLESSVQLLQYHVATLVDNQLNGVSPSAQRTGRLIKSIAQRLKAKEGRVRGSLMGKRVDYSGRTVITADPNISIDELGVPAKIAMNLTFPEVAGPHNIRALQAMVDRGASAYPGAKFVRKPDNRLIMLRDDIPIKVVLQAGDVVDRHLLDGDYVIFNRQPSLHRCSMMAHRIVVLPHDTFRLNVCVTPPYNADFDGDEANIHVPQSRLTMTELELLSSVPNHIVSPRDCKPIVSIVQDVALGVYKMTMPGAGVHPRELCNILSRLSVLGSPKVRAFLEDTRRSGASRVQGRDLLSLILPAGTAFVGPNRFYDETSEDSRRDDYVVVRGGRVLQGTVDKQTYQARSRGILHSTHNDSGPQRSRCLMDDTQKAVCDWLVLEGASVGLSDFMVDAPTKAKLDSIIQSMKVRVCATIESGHCGGGGRTPVNLEKDINNVLNDTVSKAGKTGLSSIGSSNRMIQMIKSGSKGNIINISQILACVGQQNIDGSRVVDGYDGRTLPHFEKYDNGPEARGFVENSFLSGLNPKEFFFHAMAGREGLIHTAVNTSETGYIQRKLVKAMEDCKVHYDLSVRDAGGHIVSFAYGDDRLDPTKLEVQTLFHVEYDSERMLREFFAPGLEDHFAKLCEERLLLASFCARNGGDVAVSTSVPFSRMIGMRPEGRANAVTSAADDMREMARLVDEAAEALGASDPMLRCLVRLYASPKRAGVEGPESMRALLREVEERHRSALVHPCEMVGIVAAQSIGEPSSQCTLNTFHLSGVASASRVVRGGVPRLKEILSVAKSIKSPSMRVHLLPPANADKFKANAVANDLRSLKMRDVFAESCIYYDASDALTTVENDAFYLRRERDLGFGRNLSATGRPEAADVGAAPWILRVSMDREKMDLFAVSMLDVCVAIKRCYVDKVDVFCTDDCDEDLFVRVRPLADARGGAEDALLFMKALERNVLNTMCLKGLDAFVEFDMELLRSREFDPSTGRMEAAEEWVVNTVGSDLREVFSDARVDISRTVTNDISEVLAVLGIEAARALLADEIQSIMRDSDVTVNDRHVNLLADVMTRRGTITSVDRHGLNRGDTGSFLSKCSFEETVDVLVKAAVGMEVDRMASVSSNVIFGQVPLVGTGVGSYSLDLDLLKEPDELDSERIVNQLLSLDDDEALVEYTTAS